MRRWQRRLGLFALIALAVVLALMVGTWLFISSPPGERLIQRKLVAALDEVLPGNVEVGALDVSANVLVFHDLVLRDPEGLVVARVGRLEVALGLHTLVLEREVDLHEVKLEDVDLDLLLDERGLNLLRAVVKAEREADLPESEGSVVLRVRKLTLERGALRFRQSTLDAVAEEAKVADLGLRGALTFRGGKGALEGNVSLQGQVQAPAQGPLRLDVTLDHTQQKSSATVALQLLDAALQAGLDGDLSKDSLRANLTLLHLPSDDLRALLPVWPLRADARATGALSLQGDEVTSDLDVKAGRGSADVKGRVNLSTLEADGVDVQARGVDLAELFEGGPRSDLALSLTGRARGTTLETLSGAVVLSMPPSTVDGQAFGPVSLNAQAQDGHFTVSELDARVPGARLTGGGAGTLESIRFDGRLVASDLALTARTLGRLARPEGLPLAGQGELAVTVQGPPRHPGVSAKGGFKTLRWEDVHLRALELDAKLGDIRRPLDADARLRIGTLRTGERQFRDVRGDIVTRGRELTASVTAQGFADVALRLKGLLDGDREGIALFEVEARYPEATWTLERPAHLRFGGGDITVDELWLRSGRQRLGVGGGLRGTRIDMRAWVENLELSSLPKAALPADLGLGGELTVRATAQGTTRKPTAAAQVELRNGRIQAFTDLGLTLDARYANDRAEGRLRVLAFASELEGTFEMPVSRLTRGSKGPLRGDFAIRHTRLETLFTALGVDPGLTGNAAATLQVMGTAAEPQVRIVVDGDEVRQREGPPGDLNVVVESGADGKLIARIDLFTMGSESDLLLRTPWVAGQFLTGPVTGRMFIETPVELEASFRDVPLVAAHAWGLLPAKLDGTASLSIKAHGAVLRPEGTLLLTVNKAASPQLAPTDASLKVVAGADAVQGALSLHRGKDQLVELEATLGESLGGLFAGADPERVAVTLDGTVNHLTFAELDALSAPPSPEPAERRPANGVLWGKVHLEGSFAEPRATLSARVDKLGMGELALGKAELDARYANGRAFVQALLTSTRGGQASIDGQAQVDLSTPSVARGIAWRRVPVQVAVSARKFDPSFLSGVHPLVRELSGLIDADARVLGPVGAPDFRGHLAWVDGRLGLMGYGQYRNIQLRLQGTQEAVVLENLSAQSGAGEVRFALRADRKGDLFLLGGGGTLDGFPLIVDDQLQAILSGRLELSGDASRDQLFIRNLAIPELHVELPEVRRKDLQGLERPSDIILVRNGEPLYRRRDVAKGAGGAAAEGAPAGEPGPDAMRFVVLINAPRNLWIRGADVNAELGLSEDFRIELSDRALMYGEVRFLRGRVDVLGRRFDVLRDSQVRFAGPPLSPYINVTAEHGNEREQVAVFTTVRGQGRDITIRVSSKPALSESEIYTLLATGRRTLKRGSGASMTGAEAASVVGSYAASQLRRVIATKLPIDVLSVEAGAQGLADASLEAGAYLSDRIYLGGIWRLGARQERNENTGGFRLEYQMTPRWNFETEYGTARAGGADIMWSRDY